MILAALAAVALSAVHPPDVELIGEMDSALLENVQAHLAVAMVEKKDVTLRISSPGGDGIAMFLFIDQVLDMKARQHAKVTCVASIMAASAAAILLESPVCDRRAMTDATILLFHGVRSGARGKTGDIDDELHLLKGLDRMVANMIAPRMGMTPDAYLAWIDRRDQWLTSDEARERRAVDEILPSGVPASPLPVAPVPPVLAAPVVPSAPPVPGVCPPPPVSARERVEQAKAWARAHLLEIQMSVQAALVLAALWVVLRRPRPAPVRRKHRK